MTTPTVPAMTAGPDDPTMLAAPRPEHPTPADRIVPADSALLSRWERRVVLGLWFLAGSLLPLLVWVLEGRLDLLFAALVWLVTLGVTTPLVSATLGHVDPLAALPPDPGPLPHLPPALARMVHEAAAIREDLGHDLDAALERAWILTNEFDQLPAEQRADLDRSHAALAPVRALLDQRAGAGPHADRTRRILAAALADFAAALAEPPRFGFR